MLKSQLNINKIDRSRERPVNKFFDPSIIIERSNV